MNERGGNLRVLELLRDGRWHTAAEIERLCEVTCHSRISDLRNRHGHVIERRRNPGGTGRATFMYRLVATGSQVGEARVALAELDAGAGSSSASDGSHDAPALPRMNGAAVGEGSGPPGPSPAAADRPRTVTEVVELLRRHGLVEVGTEEHAERLFEPEAVAA